MARHPRFGRLAPFAAAAVLALALPLPFAATAGAQSPAPSPAATAAPASPEPTTAANQAPIISTGPAPAGTGAAVDLTPTEATLEASLLTADDLPPGFKSDGIVEGSNFDLDAAALKKHKAGRIVSQVWSTDLTEDGPFTVFDFRITFDSPAEAAAYLKDAEAVISERTVMDLKKVKNAPGVGKNHRLYQMKAENDTLSMEFNNHLFTVGPVAAKVFVSSGLYDDADKDALAIARAAAKRMGAAQDGPVPTDEPTVEPTDAPTPEPTTAPSGEPTEPGPDVSPIFQAILVGHASPAFTDCQPVTAPAFEGELGGISCPIRDTGEIVVFRQMDSLVSMQTAFESLATTVATPAGTCATGSGLEPRFDGDEEVGQLSCYDASDGQRVFLWTDSRYAILSWIVSTTPRPFADLFADATAAGPFPIAATGPEPSDGPQPTDGPQPSAGAFPDDAQAALLEHIPDNHRDLCGPPDIQLNENAITGIVCRIELASGPLTVTYQQYATDEDMDGGYQANLDFMQVERDAGPCKDSEWPGEIGYKVGDQSVGRLACNQFGDAASFMSWTDTRFQIQGYAEGFGVTKEDLYTWWLEQSGPV